MHFMIETIVKNLKNERGEYFQYFLRDELLSISINVFYPKIVIHVRNLSESMEVTIENGKYTHIEYQNLKNFSEHYTMSGYIFTDVMHSIESKITHYLAYYKHIRTTKENIDFSNDKMLW